jgi:hypothetical protein
MNKIKQYLSGARHLIACFGTKYSEYLSILVVFIIILVSPSGLRLIDPSAAPLDIGVLSAIIMTVAAVMIFKSVTWLLIRSIWPVFAEYSREHFERNFKVLNPCQKVLIYLGFYSLLFVSFIAALIAFLH